MSISARLIRILFVVILAPLLCLSDVWLSPNASGEFAGKPAWAKRSSKGEGQWVVLDGRKTRVVWNDGDSFRVIRGPHKEMRARLSGYNTLESYGPIHFWGPHHAYELYDNAKAGTKLAQSQAWECTIKEGGGGYNRTLVDCPELRDAMISQGLAHVFAVVGNADPKLVALQLEAQNNRRGMWKRTIPSKIVTSIHSVTEIEKDGEKAVEAYNRVCDTRTGRSWKVKHSTVFRPCDAWCSGGSCMIYVPFDLRYGKKRPKCLRMGRDNKLVLPSHLDDPLSYKR